jgi:drug/metabolite transporter (DMT)-like permease
MSTVLPALASLCLGTALVTARFGLRRGMDPRAAAATSVPSAALMFALCAPVLIDWRGLVWQAVVAFGVVGLFFPAAVTLLNFASTRRIGPALTGSISGTSPLFSLLAAWVLLGEAIPARALAATLGVMAGVTLITWQRRQGERQLALSDLSLAALGAAIRGVSLILGKAALTLWHNPLAAVTVGYAASALVLVLANRGLVRRKAANGGDALARGLFVLTGVLNGLALFSMYRALETTPVSVVAPVAATYPVVTLVLGSLLLRDERLSPRRVLGLVAITFSVIWLVA